MSGGNRSGWGSGWDRSGRDRSDPGRSIGGRRGRAPAWSVPLGSWAANRARRAAAAAALVGLAAAGGLTAGCGIGLQQIPAGHSAEGPSYSVTAVFDHADRVLDGAEVRMGQKVIGRVHGTATDGRRARIRLSLQRDVPLPADVRARIELPSGLGNPFVRIEEPDHPDAPDAPENPAAPAASAPAAGAAILADGDVIPLSRTEVGPEIETSLASLGLLLNGSGLDQLSTVTTELQAAYGGRGPQVRDLIDNLDAVLGAADEHRDDLDRALDAVDALTATLYDGRGDLDRGLAAAAPVVSRLADQRERISGLIESASGIAQTSDTLLSAESGRIGAGLDRLQLVLQALRSFNDTDTATLQDTNLFIERFMTTVRGDYLSFDGALDVPGTFENLWSGTRGGGVPGGDPAGSADVVGGFAGSADAAGSLAPGSGRPGR